MSEQQQLSLLDDHAVDFTVQRSSRRTVSIIVRQGKVEVKAPWRTPETWIEAFVREKRPWIQQQLREQERKLSERLRIVQNGRFSLLGRTLQFELIRSQRSQAVLQGDRLCLFSRHTDSASLDALFQRWLKAQAADYMTARTEDYARQLGVAARLQGVKFRRTRSKWGHCDRHGVIQYNWLVMLAPQDVVDYLIAHETSHLVHMNHSAAFWQTVARLCPEYPDLRHWLRENGHRFWTA